MGIFELVMLGVGLSMDAFAVSMCKGLQLRRVRAGHLLAIGGAFGGARPLPFVPNFARSRTTFLRQRTQFARHLALTVR